MFQEFNTDTLGGRFIKSLLSQTPVPSLKCVSDGDHLVEGEFYIYKSYVIECCSSGILGVAEGTQLVVSPNVYPSVYLYVQTGYKPARFYVRSLVDPSDPTYFHTFHSTTNLYDSETHYYLGKYLRYIKATADLNLLPFYNCYNSKYIPNIELSVENRSDVVVKDVSSQKYKVTAVPILFGRTYTIAVDCATEVLMRACLVNSTGVIYEDSKTLSFIDKYETIDDTTQTGLKKALMTSGKIFDRLIFKDPVTFRIETTSKYSTMFEKCLYLLIQLPLDNTSTITVLDSFTQHSGVKCNKNGVKQREFFNPSLLYMNSHKSFAFSDRLMEYLLGNVISSSDPISNNIAYVQSMFAKNSAAYNNKFINGKFKKGVWDSSLSSHIFTSVEHKENSALLLDQDGNFNKDLHVSMLS